MTVASRRCTAHVGWYEFHHTYCDMGHSHAGSVRSGWFVISE